MTYGTQNISNFVSRPNFSPQCLNKCQPFLEKKKVREKFNDLISAFVTFIQISGPKDAQIAKIRAYSIYYMNLLRFNLKVSLFF